MNELSKKPLFTLVASICLAFYSSSNIQAQNIMKTADTINHNINQVIQPKDTLNSQDYEIIYDTMYVIGDTIRVNNKHTVLLENKPKRTAKSKSKLEYSLDFSSSLFYSYSNISAQSESYAQYAFIRQKAQIPKLSYRIGSNFKVQKKQHSIDIGVGIANFREMQDYASSSWNRYTVTYMKLDTIDSYYDVKGQDTSRVYVTKENQHTRIDSLLQRNSFKNQYLYFEIPIIYGFKKDIRNFSLYLRAGLIFDFLVKISGRTLSTTNPDEYIDVGKESLYRKVNVSLWLGAALHYPLNNRLDLVAEPYFIKGFMSKYRSNNAIFQNQLSYGLRFGLSYKF